MLDKNRLLIRQENASDHIEVFKIIELAFKNEEFSDHREQFLVNRLRKSKAFVPELALVAVYNDIIVGHILLTKIKIINKSKLFSSLALAPVSVLPKYQGQGLGGLLIKHAHKAAKKIGFQSVVLVGHANYYPKFGYRTAASYSIELPFEAVPRENCMAIELVENGLKKVAGMVVYPREFEE